MRHNFLFITNMKQKTKRAGKGKAQNALPAGRQGSALLLTTILLFVILGMVVSLTYVTVMEQKMSSKTKSSVGSFYSAESGIEWALNKIATTSTPNPVIADAFPSFSAGKTSCPADFNCEVLLLDQNGKVITSSATDLSEVRAVRSVGTQGNETQRAIEAAVAAGETGCYVSYAAPPGAADPTGKCLQGFTNMGSAGTWGYYKYAPGSEYAKLFFRPPAGGCSGEDWCTYPLGVLGEAFVCCK